MKKMSIRDKQAVDNLNQTYGFPLPGSKSRIYVKYARPQTYEGAISIIVSGWITDENKVKHPFSGALLKQLGANFKDISKDLTDSLADANTKAGSPIADAYDFVSTKIIPSVPYDAMDDFFKGIKQKKKKKVNTKTPTAPVAPAAPQPTVDIVFNKGQKVEVDISEIRKSKTNPDLYAKIININPNIVAYPFAIVNQSVNNISTVIFKNKTYIDIPNDYLDPVTTEQEKSQDERVLDYYESAKSDPERMKHLSDNILEFVKNYKSERNIPLDNIDTQLFKNIKPQNSTQKPNSWIKNIIDKSRNYINR